MEIEVWIILIFLMLSLGAGFFWIGYGLAALVYWIKDEFF